MEWNIWIISRRTSQTAKKNPRALNHLCTCQAELCKVCKGLQWMFRITDRNAGKQDVVWSILKTRLGEDHWLGWLVVDSKNAEVGIMIERFGSCGRLQKRVGRAHHLPIHGQDGSRCSSGKTRGLAASSLVGAGGEWHRIPIFDTDARRLAKSLDTNITA